MTTGPADYQYDRKKQQGFAMGIFGAGNAGAALNIFAAPLIIVAMGWRSVPVIYSVAMLVMAFIFLFAKKAGI
jgi:NNP family nitrate/nitrite transporter-like MFS transporter